MITIDGTDGGGQVLRSALTLSVLQDQPVHITDIRGARDTPGLRPQHLAAVRVMEELTDADVEGASEGAEEVTFAPGHRPRGDIEIDIGTAGSITLLFETVLPIGPTVSAPITVTATGGTDVKWSPTMDYLRLVKLPCLRSHGHDIDVTVTRRGFYPNGGGQASLRVAPAQPTPFDLRTRGRVEGVHLYSRATSDLEDRAVATRQVESAAATLDDVDVTHIEVQPDCVDADCTGSSLLAVASVDGGYLGADALGERGVSAETVGHRVATGLKEELATGAPVDRHLADQLLLPLALAGGNIQIPTVTEHVRSNAAVLEAFGIELSVKETNDAHHVSCPTGLADS